MRAVFFCLALITLTACGPVAEAPRAGCARSASHQVNWSGSEAADTVTARAEGPSCAQAAVTLAVRNSAGDPLWRFASTYYDMTLRETPIDPAPVSVAEMDAFLASWANVTEMRTSALPQWREGVATLTESASTFAYDTPFDRETYESLRARDLKMICYAAAAEATQCLIIDPISNAPTMIVAYGP